MRKSILVTLAVVVACALAFAAAADGTWNIQGNVSNAPQHLVLAVNGATLTGTIDGIAISNGKAEFSSIWFTAVRGGGTYNYKGTVNGIRLSLYEQPPSGSGRLLTYARAN